LKATIAAAIMNLPLLGFVWRRVRRSQPSRAHEDVVIAVGAWAMLVAAAAAFVRGGSAEWAAGVPSRYADFLVLLPLVNLWCLARLAGELAGPRTRPVRWVAAAWGVFFAVGWAGLSAEMWRGVILPRMRDRDAPIRLARAFRQSGDETVFEGQPRLLVPHPNASVVRAVLTDPRMTGVLPPSLQPERPQGSWSRAVRSALGRQ
jgi:hypothetical protein